MLPPTVWRLFTNNGPFTRHVLPPPPPCNANAYFQLQRTAACWLHQEERQARALTVPTGFSPAPKPLLSSRTASQGLCVISVAWGRGTNGTPATGARELNSPRGVPTAASTANSAGNTRGEKEGAPDPRGPPRDRALRLQPPAAPQSRRLPRAPAAAASRPAPAPGGRYLGGPDLADAGFLGQAADAADETERVAELLPAGLKYGALGRGHELGRVARPAAPRHGRRGEGAADSGAREGGGERTEARAQRGGPQRRPVGQGRRPRRILRRPEQGRGRAGPGRAGRGGAGGAARPASTRGGSCRVSSPRPPGLPPPAPSPSGSRSSSSGSYAVSFSPPPEAGAVVVFRPEK